MTHKRLFIFIITASCFGASAASAQSRDPTDVKLSECILPAAQYGQYSSYDGGKSAAAILMKKCPAEWTAWMDACEARGDTEASCTTKSAILAQMAIKMFGK